MRADEIGLLSHLRSALNYLLTVRSRTGLSMALCFLAACSRVTPATLTPTPAEPPAPSEPVTTPTATPDPCTGWTCTIEGVVYDGSMDPERFIGEATVMLRQTSYCSPTRGEHHAKTNEQGEFKFELFIHDTDGILLQVESIGFLPWEDSLAGMDCLFCSCPPLEIVLEKTD